MNDPWKRASVMFQKQRRELWKFASKLREELATERYEACWDDRLAPNMVSRDFLDWRSENEEVLRGLMAAGQRTLGAHMRSLPNDRYRAWSYVAMIQMACEAAAVLNEIERSCEYPASGPQMTATVLDAVYRAHGAVDTLWPQDGWAFEHE